MNLDAYKDEKLQKFFRERMGSMKVGDRFVIPTTTKIYTLTSVKDVPTLHKDTIRIPPAFDHINPERGLIGMVKNFRSIHAPDVAWKLWSVQVHKGTDVIIFDGETLDLALIAAIKGQIEQEEK